MKLKLTLLRPGGHAQDITVTADSTATVGDVAATIARRDPQRDDRADLASDGLTLRVHSGVQHDTGDVIARDLTVPESDLRSGMTVSVAASSGRWHASGSERGPAAATLTVQSGPEAGRRVPLPDGTSYLGRGDDADVKLADPLVSKRHARITITDKVEIADLGSANGLVIGGDRVDRAVLRPQDSVTLGDTTISVTVQRNLAVVTGPGAATADVYFNRSPRLDPTYEGRKFVAPDPPELAKRSRFPLLAMLSPLIMGVVLYAFTKSVLSIIFVGLSPLLMLGSYIDGVVTTRREEKAAAQQFRDAVAATKTAIETAHDDERAGRLAENPSTREALDAIERRSPLLWTRRTEHERFLTVRLGIGSRPSRHTVELPTSNKTKPEYWQALQELAEFGAVVHGVPVVCDIRDSGALGIAGPRESALGITRGIVMQFVALHSPADLALAAVVSADDAVDWDWLKWLPHCGGPHSPLPIWPLGSTAQDVGAVVSALEELVAARSGEGDAETGPAVLLLVQRGAPVDTARLVDLCESGPQAGVYVVWVAGAQEQLPAACRDYVVVGTADGVTSAGFVKTAVGVSPIDCELVDGARATSTGRALAPVADIGARVNDDSDLPQSISLLSLLGPDLAAEASSVVGRWNESGSITDRTGTAAVRKRPPGLVATIGQGAAGPLSIDLRSQGPHALVGGTTGAGKSEFLQSWVLGLAAGYGPDALTFLFVDYKGGSAFGDCDKLPHCVGMVTDLSPHLVQRALTSLNAELHYREKILNAKKAKDLLELQRRGDPDAPPSLIIVVDEFAALAQEVPEFVDGVVNVAQRGRSLGLHLILATQRPAGVIKDNLRANTNLRVALRMADEEDSKDVLGDTMAADFSPDIPGRAAVRTGPGRLTRFQAAYAGGWTSEEPPPSQVDVDGLLFGRGRPWVDPEAGGRHTEEPDRGPNDVRRMVETIRVAAEQASVPPPRKPWLAELAQTYDLQFLGQRRDSQLAFGVVDDPARQEQRTVFFRPDDDGNIAILGASGSGKSCLLRTLAVAAGITPRSGPCQVYGIDFGTAGLRVLETLPHVGAVIQGDDAERVGRLIRRLRGLVDERAQRYGEVHAGSIDEYRDLSGRADEPRLLLLIDGLAAFREAYEYRDGGSVYAAFLQLAAAGRPVGVHIAAAADRPGSIPPAFSSSVQRRVVLRLADDNDYSLVDVAGDVLGAASPPGRGVVDGLDLQVAVLGGSANVAEQSEAVERLAKTLTAHGVQPAEPIRSLPDQVLLRDLPVAGAGAAAVGVSGETLESLAIPTSGFLIVAGPTGSGREDVLAAVAQSTIKSGAVGWCGVIAPPKSSLGQRVPGAVTLRTEADVHAALDSLPAARPAALFIEDAAGLVGDEREGSAVALAREIEKRGGFVVAESETSTWLQYSDLLKLLRSHRTGLLVQPDEEDGTSLLRTELPRCRRRDFVVCGGMYVRAGAAVRAQFAEPD